MVGGVLCFIVVSGLIDVCQVVCCELVELGYFVYDYQVQVKVCFGIEVEFVCIDSQCKYGVVV